MKARRVIGAGFVSMASGGRIEHVTAKTARGEDEAPRFIQPIVRWQNAIADLDEAPQPHCLAAECEHASFIGADALVVTQ